MKNPRGGRHAGDSHKLKDYEEYITLAIASLSDLKPYGQMFFISCAHLIFAFIDLTYIRLVRLDLIYSFISSFD